MFVQLVTLQNYFNALMEGIHPQGYQKKLVPLNDIHIEKFIKLDLYSPNY